MLGGLILGKLLDFTAGTYKESPESGSRATPLITELPAFHKTSTWDLCRHSCLSTARISQIHLYIDIAAVHPPKQTVGGNGPGKDKITVLCFSLYEGPPGGFHTTSGLTSAAEICESFGNPPPEL